VLSAPVNWAYVFVNASFLQNKTVYLTVICVSVIYILMMIYARFKDKKDLEKVNEEIEVRKRRLVSLLFSLA
jgi:hypothetical protein